MVNSMFQFNCVGPTDVRILLQALPEYGSAGTDSLACKVLNITAGYILSLLSHILNSCLLCGILNCGRRKKIMPLLKCNELPCSGPTPTYFSCTLHGYGKDYSCSSLL